MTAYKILMPVFLIIAAFSHVSAQSNLGSIKGKLKDSATKGVLSLATVTVFRAKDTVIITYRLTDQNGDFKVPSLPLNVTCRMLISFSGLKPYRKEFELTKENPQIDFGIISLSSDARMLDEVFVKAERPPVTIRKDTIEFNASAFKTLPSALLEDLLKKLPGIDIDADGTIRVKGKPVNRLLVDGKDFFGGDPKIATKNLPANIVDKVQVMDDKEQLERDPDIAPADLGQVVNIKLKKAIKQGWFGKAYAGGGTDARHEIGAIVNAFRDTTQISVLAYSNNINKSGFNIEDLNKIGGFQRSGTNYTSVYSSGGIEVNGISFGATGQGIQQSIGGGVNFNHQFKKNVTLNLQYFYGQVNSAYESLSNRQRFLQDTTQVMRSNSNNKGLNGNHRIGGTVIWKIDSFATLTFRPGLTLSNSSSSRYSYTAISDNIKGNLNAEDNKLNSLGNGSSYSHNLFLNKTWKKKKGRLLTINNNVSVNENLNNQYYDLINTYYVDPAIIFSNQLRQRETTNFNTSVNALYNEPISKTTGVRIGHTIEYSKEGNSLRPYNKDSLTAKYANLIDSMYSGLDRTLWRNTSTAGVTWRKKKTSITASLNYQSLAYINNYLKGSSVNQSYHYFYPSLNINLNGFNLSYSTSIRPPSAYDLQPILDNTNRQFLYTGNPNLKPSYSHNVSANYYKYKPTGSNYSIYLQGNITDNAVIRENSIDRAGIQTSRPLNVSGLKGLYGYFSYSIPYKFNQNFRLTISPNMYGNYNDGVVAFNGNRSGSKNYYSGGALVFGFNLKDKIELNERYSFNFSETKYDDHTYYKDISTITHSAESEIVLRWPKHVVWENLVNYSYNPQVSPGIRKQSIRWNSGVNYLFLKDDKGQLKLSVFDLLNQNINVYRYASENSISDNQTTTLRRYFMLTFTYNIRTFKPAKVGGKDRSFFMF